MSYTETLHWILDKPGERGYSDENARRRIDFVHSLGLKCDSVGWCSMSLSAPGADGLLNRIEAHCREDNWQLRAHYDREYTDVQSDWYVLRTSILPFTAMAGGESYPTVDGNTGEHLVIKACNIPSPGAQKYSCDSLIVPERFRDACVRAGIPGLDFCWVRDKGRYDAPQYFAPYAVQTLPRFVFHEKVIWYSKDSKKHQPLLEALGGHLPRLMAACSELWVSLPNCVFRADLPAGGVVQAHSDMTRSCNSCNELLIHKATAELLLRENGLPASALIPILTVAELPEGHPINAATPLPRPAPAYFAAMDAACAALKAKARPVKQITEKMALAQLRKAKAARKEDFGKRLAKADALLSTPYAPLVPYWKLAERGFLSDEYELLSLASAAAATQEYEAQRAAEELADLPEGVVFAKCPDGDTVLLTSGGRVLRISHEEPLPCQEWPGLPAFFADIIEDSE